MSLVVRPSTPDDLSGVLAVFLACWRNSYQGVLPAAAIDAMDDARAESLWRRVLADPVGMVLVAERDGIIVGLTRFAEMSENEGAVHSLYVSPHAHGGGIGRLLLNTAADELRSAGKRTAFLWVFAANAPSIGFYEAHGWEADGQTRTQAEFGELEQRMRKGLV